MIRMKTINVAFGKFNPITCEHEKLLDLLYANEGDHRVYIFGAISRYTKVMRMIDISRFYPKMEIVSTEDNPYDAIVNLCLSPYERINIFCGIGDDGIQKARSEGASYNELTRLMKNIHKKVPEAPIEKIVLRMNPRGRISGSLVREYIWAHGPLIGTSMKATKEMLHSKYTEENIQYLSMLFSESD